MIIFKNIIPQENFVTLLQELKTALDAQGMSLTVVVTPNVEDDALIYDVAAIDATVDRIHLMTYDFHGPWEDFTHHNSPLYPRSDDSGLNAELNVVRSIIYNKIFYIN